MKQQVAVKLPLDQISCQHFLDQPDITRIVLDKKSVPAPLALLSFSCFPSRIPPLYVIFLLIFKQKDPV